MHENRIREERLIFFGFRVYGVWGLGGLGLRFHVLVLRVWVDGEGC